MLSQSRKGAKTGVLGFVIEFVTIQAARCRLYFAAVTGRGSAAP